MQAVALLFASVTLAQDPTVVAPVAKESGDLKQPRPKPGLPGLTPVKKAAEQARTGEQVKYTQFRNAFQGAFCPTAQGEDKFSIACKMYAFNQKLKAATTPEEKKAINTDRMAMFTQLRTKFSSAEEKKILAQKAKAIYTKAYATYCTPDKANTDAACTNTYMKKLYGPKVARRLQAPE